MNNANRVEISAETQIIELQAIEASLKARTVLLGQLLRNSDTQLGEANASLRAALDRACNSDSLVETMENEIQSLKAKLDEALNDNDVLRNKLALIDRATKGGTD